MSEPDFILNAKMNGKDVKLSIQPNDLDELYSNLLDYRQRYARAHSEKIVREAAEIAIEVGKISTELLQRRLLIGYGRAASIIDELEVLGVIGPASGGNKPREVLMESIDEYDNIKGSQK